MWKYACVIEVLIFDPWGYKETVGAANILTQVWILWLLPFWELDASMFAGTKAKECCSCDLGCFRCCRAIERCSSPGRCEERGLRFQCHSQNLPEELCQEVEASNDIYTKGRKPFCGSKLRYAWCFDVLSTRFEGIALLHMHIQSGCLQSLCNGASWLFVTLISIYIIA